MRGLLLNFASDATIEAAIAEYVLVNNFPDDWITFNDVRDRMAEMIEVAKGIPKATTEDYLIQTYGAPFKSPAQRRWFFATHPEGAPGGKEDKGKGEPSGKEDKGKGDRWPEIMQAARDAVKIQPGMTGAELILAVNVAIEPDLTDVEEGRVHELVSPERAKKLVGPPEKTPGGERTPEIEELIEQEWSRIQKEREEEEEKKREKQPPQLQLQKGPQNRPKSSPGKDNTRYAKNIEEMFSSIAVLARKVLGETEYFAPDEEAALMTPTRQDQLQFQAFYEKAQADTAQVIELHEGDPDITFILLESIADQLQMISDLVEGGQLSGAAPRGYLQGLPQDIQDRILGVAPVESTLMLDTEAVHGYSPAVATKMVELGIKKISSRKLAEILREAPGSLVGPPEKTPGGERKEEEEKKKEKRPQRLQLQKGPQNRPKSSPGKDMIPPFIAPGIPHRGAAGKDGYLSKKDFFCKKYCDIADAEHWRAFVQAVPLIRGGHDDSCVKEILENEYPGIDIDMVLKAAKDFIKRGSNDPYIGGGTLAMRLIKQGSSSKFVSTIYQNLLRAEVSQEYLTGFRVCCSP